MNNLSSQYLIAVVGATGNVGRQILGIMEQRKFPARKVIPLASSRSAGMKLTYNNEEITVQILDHFDFSGVDLALSSPGASVSAIYAPKAAKAGCVVIDNTSHFRMQDNVPLIVPEVNYDAIRNHRNIISNPNCSTIQLVMVLSALLKYNRIKRVVISTYQSVSGAGKGAMDELTMQLDINKNGKHEGMENNVKQIAYNVVPQIDVFLDDGSTKEEWKMREETKKILDRRILLSATCVRVPVYVGHSESVNIEFESPITPDQARSILSNSSGVRVIDEPETSGYVTPVDCAGTDSVYVSRIRKDPTIANGLDMWITADNVRKGAALNTIQIAEALIELHREEKLPLNQLNNR